MFTGLVEGQAAVHQLRREKSAIRLTLRVPEALAGGCCVGDSVAINGCCLTAVETQDRLWSFEAGDETLSKTNLGDLSVGDPVNIERSLPANGRLGGHFVQGHVDGVGHVVSLDHDGEWATLWVTVPEHLARQMVAKGSVAVDGISLTLVNIEADRFSIALIPHTLAATNLGSRKAGDKVNIETDILGKYVQRMLGDAGFDRRWDGG
jgi:riboflavin synthase